MLHLLPRPVRSLPGSRPGLARPWAWKIRTFNRLLAGSLPVGAVACALAGDGTAALNLAIPAPVIGLALAARAPAGFETAFVWTLVLELWWNAVANLSSLEYGDETAHFVLPALVAPLLFFALERSGVARRPSACSPVLSLIALAMLAAGVTIGLGALWEIAEWGSDRLLHTDMSLGYNDTLTDLVADSLGAALGGLFLAVWTKTRSTAGKRSVDRLG